MKKIILCLVIMFMTALNINAQIATENPKFLDNVYVGIEGGAATQMDMNSVFPWNAVAGIKIGKELTPIVGVEIFNQFFFGDNTAEKPWSVAMVKGNNLGANATINLNNLFDGYPGKPRVFEIKVNSGLSWIHRWCYGGNSLGCKTALDFNINMGKKRAHSIYVSPGVYWDLNKTDGFNKHWAQLGLFVGYIYHFKTSNGTHYFKTYDVGAMISEIDRLNAALSTQIKPKTVEIEKEVVVEKEVVMHIGDVVVFFAQNSAKLTDDAKQILDKIVDPVDIVGFASPEGTKKYNLRLSEKRANVVADYLKNRGITVNKVTGEGVVNATSGRVAVIKINN